MKCLYQEGVHFNAESISSKRAFFVHEIPTSLVLSTRAARMSCEPQSAGLKGALYLEKGAALNVVFR
jgi:hypothetical protein